MSKQDDYKHIKIKAEYLRKIIIRRMEQNNITVPQLAKKAKVPYSNLYKYIKGLGDISSGMLISVIIALNAKIIIYSIKEK